MCAAGAYFAVAAACGDDQSAQQGADPAEAACVEPCVAKGGTAEECDAFCEGAGDKPSDGGERLPALPDEGAPGTYTLSFEHDGTTREAIVCVPASYAAADPTPLLLNFHGFGGTARDHMAAADMRGLADEEGFLLVYPQGSLLDGQTHWNSAAPSADNKSEADDFGYVGELLYALASSLAVDEARVYAAGYSNGGMMSFGLACYLRERIAAVASVSGAMLDDIGVACVPAHPTSVITPHGTGDPVLPYDGGAGMRSVEDLLGYWTEFNGITDAATTASVGEGGAEVESTVYEGGMAGTEVHHYRVVGGGHVWFDLKTDGVDTNRLVWDFLSRFDRDGAR